MSVIYQNLNNVVAVTVGCSGWNVKKGFLHIHLSDGKIIRFNEHENEKELEMLKDILNGNVKVGIKRKRKYYYLETVINNE